MITLFYALIVTWPCGPNLCSNLGFYASIQACAAAQEKLPSYSRCKPFLVVIKGKQAYVQGEE